MKFSFKTVFTISLFCLLIGVAIGLFGYEQINGAISNPVQNQNPASCVSGSEIQTYFCPADNCSTHLISEINSAKTRLHVAIYSFTLSSVADAVLAAKSRGVDVKIVVDKQQSSVENSEYDSLKKSGVDIHLDGNPALMHDKFAVIDDSEITTGSFNWTGNADSHNNENLVIIKSAELNQQFENEFQKIYSEAE